MSKKLIAYWLATLGFSAVMAGGGVMDLLLVDQVAQTLTHLGYPHYFGVMLGACKILGVILLLLPQTPRLKEWAYCGFAIDLAAAFVSHAVVGDGVSKLALPTALFALGAVSYFLRPSSRRL